MTDHTKALADALDELARHVDRHNKVLVSAREALASAQQAEPMARDAYVEYLLNMISSMSAANGRLVQEIGRISEVQPLTDEQQVRLRDVLNQSIEKPGEAVAIPADIADSLRAFCGIGQTKEPSHGN